MKKKNKKNVYLRNLQRKVKIDVKNLRRRINRALEFSGLSFRQLGVILVSDQKIIVYNRQFLGHNRPTDVLSFALEEAEGEILISAETAEAQAKELRHSLEEELLILAIHGFLHLAGYDDRKIKDRRVMFRETRRILMGCKTNDGKTQT
ncbi:MAG: rRNA maturation RNase YbeY [Candidatus Omnitrophica bacterium]|nr:rRNA maturation RNase YbeY [Candidatus Omnitrophota bacterium]